MTLCWKKSENPVPYPLAVKTMEETVASIRSEKASEQVWLLEHPPLYTAGTSAKAGDLLGAGNFPVYETGRGGQYTYHGPGQRITYVMLDLKSRQQAPDIKKYIYDLEQWIIETLAAFDIQGERRDGRVGIWVTKPNGREAKIAAIGVRVRHWVTYHGISINLAPDLSHFDGIVPCGIRDAGVTSFANLGIQVSMSQLDAVLKEKFDKIF